jgi:hypothetical protein
MTDSSIPTVSGVRPEIAAVLTVHMELVFLAVGWAPMGCFGDTAALQGHSP